MEKKTAGNKEDKPKKKKPGLKPGMTNNPNGRPKGAKNKLPNKVKILLEDFAIDKFDTFKKDYEETKSGYQRAKLYADVIKPLIPRPLADEEKDALNTQSNLFIKLAKGK